MLEVTSLSDEELDFEIFYCETLDQALALIPEERRQRALKKMRVVEDTE
jgi:hypothetical protein